MIGPLRIEKLVFGGQGLGHVDGKTALVWNALAGESVTAELLRKRRGVLECLATEVAEPSPERVKPHEQHYLSCSPWQVMSWKEELEWMRRTTQEVYERIGKVVLPGSLDVVGDETRQYGYRTKMEFSVTAAPEGSPHALSLAFFARGRHTTFPIDGCELAAAPTNDVANRLLRWLEAESVSADRAKSIVVRTDGAGHAIAGVFVTNEQQFDGAPALDGELLGVTVFYSNPLSPASTPDRKLLQVGQDQLTVKVGQKEFAHGLLSFFQVNVPMFERALADTRPYVLPDVPLVDMYGGVGSIGLSIGSAAPKVTIVDIDPAAAEFATRNAERSGVRNVEAVGASAETALQYVTPDATVVVDPPRAGLHPKVVDRLLAVRPQRVIYLSCNVSTQARDLALLAVAYDVSFARLYNFFPRTPHVEGLVVLSRR